MLRTLHFSAKGAGSIPSRETKIPQAMWRSKKINKREREREKSSKLNIEK